MAIQIDGAGTITGLDATGISAQPVFPGNVLQVIEAISNTTNKTTTSTSYVTATTNASITPSNLTSKILVQWCGQGDTSTTGAILVGTVYRGATDLGIGNGADNCLFRMHDVAAGRFLANQSFMLLDEPNTTSSVTYTIYFKSGNGSSVAIRDDIQRSRIILMEIAG